MVTALVGSWHYWTLPPEGRAAGDNLREYMLNGGFLSSFSCLGKDGNFVWNMNLLCLAVVPRVVYLSRGLYPSMDCQRHILQLIHVVYDF